MTQKPRTIFERNAKLPKENLLQAQFALAAFATIKAKNITYVSVPITSGPRLYDFMDRHGFKTMAEARADHALFLKEVIEPNMAKGVEGSEVWREKLHGTVIAPAEFDGRLYRAWGKVHWNADDFMGMWVPLIDEKVTNMALLDGWQYSNGCGEEYLQAVLIQMGRRDRNNMTIMDAEEGRAMPLHEGIKLMADAFKDVLGRGIRPTNMAETLGILIEAERRFHVEKMGGHLIEPEAVSPGASKAKTAPSLPAYDHEMVAAIAREINPLLDQYFPHVRRLLAETSSYDFSPMNAVFRDGAQLEASSKPAPPPPPPRKPSLAPTHA